MTKHPHPEVPLADLHTHMGGSVDAAILWTLAHEQGIKLPTKDYWEFERLVTVQKTGKGGVLALDREKYHWTELIQSSPLAMEPAVHETLGGAYRANHVMLHELRYNPMKRNRGGERDLDHIILATIRGMEEALLEYPEIKAGIILMLDREFPYRLNKIIYEKACKYQHRGIIGLDVAGPQAKTFHIKEYKNLFRDAKKRGFGITIHTGEEGSVTEMEYIVEHIEPHRIGHGFLAHKSTKLMTMLREKKITLELCPTSNLNIGIIKNLTEMKRIYRTLFEAGVTLTINTDGPEMHGTSLWKEFGMLKSEGIFTEKEIQKLIRNAFEATFIKS